MRGDCQAWGSAAEFSISDFRFSIGAEARAVVDAVDCVDEVDVVDAAGWAVGAEPAGAELELGVPRGA